VIVTATAMSAPILPNVVAQHAEELGHLYMMRTAVVTGSAATLQTLSKLDDRLLAHLDALSLAGRHSSFDSHVHFHESDPASTFAAALWAIESRDQSSLGELVRRCDRSVTAGRAFVAALGWMEKHQLQGMVSALLSDDEPLARTLGVAVCAVHRVDPGLVSAQRLVDRHPSPRARAIRAVGELGQIDLLTGCVAALRDAHPDCQFWGAWSAVLLGNRSAALDFLVGAASDAGVHRARSFDLAVQASDVRAAHRQLQDLAIDPEQRRWVVRGSGIVGDPAYISWLIRQMAEPPLARLAAQSFITITGLDLFQGFEVDRPGEFESGPSDDPADENVEMDPDEGLPWPDVAKIEKWWAANESRFQKGTRYFMGAPVTREHCIEVLKNGYQRQRILAAHYLCLLEPGTPLFNTSAPAWRQQRLLAKMS